MLRLSFSLALALAVSTSAFAGGYSFECSDASGSIRITEQGTVLSMYGKNYVPYLNLKGLELWMANEKKESNIEISESGARAVFTRIRESRCRDITEDSFAQRVKVKHLNPMNKMAPFNVDLVCHESSASTRGGQDCAE